MKTLHRVVTGDARRLECVDDESVDLVVTSPPYPMIEMWDAQFSSLNSGVGEAVAQGDGRSAFDLMHRELDKVWEQCWRVVKPGGIVAINVGDAVRTLGGDFQMYSNHARILMQMTGIGFSSLPDILWRKPTNAPNKFMGSGMLPAGAYVTYEHEYILIFRKGAKREFRTAEEKERRRLSAYFWEERNCWFSDVWTDLRGTGQQLGEPLARARSAAFPFELPFRLISMYSLYGDTVLDPFAGTGTTSLTSIACARNSIGVELDLALRQTIVRSLESGIVLCKERVRARLAAHDEFVAARSAQGAVLKHRNLPHDLPVMTSQETDLTLYVPERIARTEEGSVEVEHEVACYLPCRQDVLF